MTTVKECPHCETEFTGEGCKSGGVLSEDFCSTQCYETAMELRQEREHERGR